MGTPSQKLAQRKPAGLTEQTWEKLSQLDPSTHQVVAKLLGGEIEFDADPDQIQRDIVRRILEAPNADAAFQLGQAEGWQDHIGEPVTVLDFHFNVGKMEGGPGVYAVVRADFGDTGGVRTLTTGSVNVMAQLIKLAMEGALPFRVAQVRAEQPSERGTYPLWLVKA